MIEQRPDLCEEHDGALPSGFRDLNELRKKQYELLEEYDGGPYGSVSKMPEFETWSKYVRTYLRGVKGPKRSRRAGRPTGSSVVNFKQI